MRHFFTLVLLFSTMWVSAQPDQQRKTDSVTRLIQKFHNNRDAASTYAMSGKAFRSQLTDTAFQDVFARLAAGLGELENLQLESFTNKLAHYKARYAKAEMSMFVSLDADDKIETYYITNYRSPVRQQGDTLAYANPLQTPLDRKVDSLVKDFILTNNILGMTVGVIDKGKEFIYRYGEIKKGSNQVPDQKTLFEIGSLTKTFTATILAWYVDQGKIKLTDPINKYLPDSIGILAFNSKPITIETLSNHTSGLPRLPIDFFNGADNSNPYRHYDNQKLFSFLKRFKPFRAPVEKYEYSNLAVGLLGVILERVSKKPYEQLLLEIICKPLKMADTKIKLNKSDSLKFSTGYAADGSYAHSWEFQSLVAAGGIRSNISDLLKYAQAQMSDASTPLQKAIALTHQQTFASGQTIVGLGWHLSTKEKYLAHSGQTGGYTSVIFCDPKQKRAVVMQLNTAVEPSHIALQLMNWMAAQ